MPRDPKEISEQMHQIAVEHCQTRQKPYISILQPRRNFKETPAQQLQSWQNRMVDMTSVAVSFHGIDQNPVDIARCYLIDKAEEDDAKYALFVDEDTVLPYYGVRNLIKTSVEFNDEKVITGIYYVKFGNVMMSVLDECERWVLPDVTPNSGLVRNVVSTGLGCALIPLKVIKKLREQFEGIPLFCIVPEKTWGDDKVTFMGEDTWFYALCKKAGIEVVGDTACHCLHMELATGKYEAHPDVNVDDYLTNIPVTTRLTMTDRNRVSKDYHDRICFIPMFDIKDKSLEQIYEEKCNQPDSNINEHLPTLKKYAEECNHVTELGVEYGRSLFAFMAGNPKKLVSYDVINIEKYGVNIVDLKKLASDNGVDYDFIEADTRKIEIEETDLLFIDTLHTYEQLKNELTLHANKARKYIILHDTVTFGINGEDGHKGILPAIDEFLLENKNWFIYENFTNNNGLMILKNK